MIRRPMCLLCLLLMSAMCLADWMGFPVVRGNPLPSGLEAWVEKHPRVRVCGEVQRYRAADDTPSVDLKQSYLIYNSEKISLKNLKVYLKKNTEEKELPVGAVVIVSGKLERIAAPRNPGGFDSRQYYACSHIYYSLRDGVIEKQSESHSEYGQFLAVLKEKLCLSLEKAAGKEAALFQAIVLGEKGELEDEEKLRYQMGGIMHIIAISGLHVSILGVGLYNLLKKAGFGIWFSGLAVLFLMLQYGILTGGSVSALRAVCMLFLSVGAKILGRIYDSMTALSIAAILLLMDSPAYLYSSSFLMSFGAVLGIGLTAPALEAMIKPKTRLFKCLLSSAAVQISMLPILLYFYGEVSLAGIFLNLLVLPTAGIVLASGFAAMLLGVFCIPGAKLAALPGRILLFLYETCCKIAGNLPFCTWIGGRPLWQQVVIYYGILLGFLLLAQYAKIKSLAAKRILCAFLLAAGVAALWKIPQKQLVITALDVGQGDCILVEVPGGGSFLIDSGSSSRNKVAQYDLVPCLKAKGIRRLDGIFVSHTDADHISGIQELLEMIDKRLTTIQVETLILPGWKNMPEEGEKLKKLAKACGITVIKGNAGQKFRSGELNFSILSPCKDAAGENINEEALVLMIDYKDFKGLFTGDIGEETEKSLMDMWEDVNLLKVAHHGSRYSTCQEFVDRVKPELALISCSKNNTYGHPSKEVIDRLKEAGCQVEYTMKNGAIEVMTNGDGEK